MNIQSVVLPSRETLKGWQEPPEVQHGEVQSPAPGDEKPHAPVQSQRLLMMGAWAGDLNQMTSKGPFQPWTVCNSVIFQYIALCKHYIHEITMAQMWLFFLWNSQWLLSSGQAFHGSWWPSGTVETISIFGQLQWRIANLNSLLVLETVIIVWNLKTTVLLLFSFSLLNLLCLTTLTCCWNYKV